MWRSANSALLERGSSTSRPTAHPRSSKDLYSSFCRVSLLQSVSRSACTCWCSTVTCITYRSQRSHQPDPQHLRSHPGARIESEEVYMIASGTLMLVRARIERTSRSSDAAKRSHDVQNENNQNQDFVKQVVSALYCAMNRAIWCILTQIELSAELDRSDRVVRP